MDFKEVKELIELINASNLAYFEMETADGHIKMDKSLDRNIGEQVSVAKTSEIASVSAKEVATSNVAVNIQNEIVDVKEDENLKVITSPMVGTFYSSPSPEKDSFVKEGDCIKVGDTVCILEAMKLMNEIESDVKGTVVKILVKDGEMVEYGAPLFKVKED